VEYKADLGNGRRLFFEKNKFTYVVYDQDGLYRAHEDEHGARKNSEDTKIKAHAFEMIFVSANESNVIEGSGENSYHYNYFIGNDQSKWASDVPVYKTLSYKNLYQGIDLVAYEKDGTFKYDYILKPGTEAKTIQLKFNGATKLEIKNKNLYITTSVGQLVESVPYAFQVIDGREIKVACAYQLAKDGETVSFYLPDGYDSRYELIIDPVLVASTYSGSSANTYGHCATHDGAGNIYTGGRCFSTGYPVTTGAYQITFGGGVDISISKLNAAGTALLYATYLGGNNADYPHSMFVNTANELYVYGSTLSADFAISSGCYDNTHNGMSDMIITKLNPAGSTLLASTYIGGSGNDGVNNNASYNYGDTFRGEIIISNSEDVYVTSTTLSSDFPTTAGAYDVTHNGLQDAVVLKMNSSLNTLQWATYLGGTQDEAGCSIRLNSSGDVYIVGLTKGSGFPTTAGAYHSTYMGGIYDGYISRLNATGTALVNSTFVSTTTRDIIYFLDIDVNNDIYVYGISDGTMPITVNTYSNGGSVNFLNKFNGALSSLIFGTVLGNGTHNAFSPSALMVDVCQNIYMAGWGANTGYPITATATQSTTTGSCFHLIVLDAGATNLLYGSFFGSEGEHVDGGTSRFDPTGVVYQAVCSCNATFPTKPGGYSPSKVSGSCDIVVFKIDFQTNCAGVITSTIICKGQTAGVGMFNINGLAGPSYSIQPGGFVSGTPGFAVTPLVTTVYTVYVTGTNAFNVVVTNTGICTVSVVPMPSVVPSVTQAICTNTNNAFNLGLTFSSSSTSGPGYSLFWAPIPFGVSNPTQTSGTGGIAAGIYNATITTPFGCSVSATFSIAPVPTTISFSVTGPFIVTCANPVVMVTPIPANYNYTWFGTTATLSGSPASFTLGNTGNWVVYATDPISGCVGSQSFVISQNITHVASALSPLTQNITCSLTSAITVTALSNPSVNVTHYWLAANGGSLVLPGNPSHYTPGTPGTYTHIAVNNANGCSISTTFTVTSNTGFPLSL